MRRNGGRYTTGNSQGVTSNVLPTGVTRGVCEKYRCSTSVQDWLNGLAPIRFYRAMHFSAFARSWDRMSSVCPSVRLSVTLVICDHIGWKSWKLIAQTISPAPSFFVAKRRSTYSQGNMGKFWGD